MLRLPNSSFCAVKIKQHVWLLLALFLQALGSLTSSSLPESEEAPLVLLPLLLCMERPSPDSSLQPA